MDIPATRENLPKQIWGCKGTKMNSVISNSEGIITGFQVIIPVLAAKNLSFCVFC